MQFKSFHWLRHHGIWAIILCSTNMISVRVTFLVVFIKFHFSFLYLGGAFNKKIISLAHVGYEMVIAKF